MALRRSGISLLETLIALVVLLIGLVPLVETFRGSFRGITVSKQHTQAMLLAEAVLEEARTRIETRLPRYWNLADTSKDIRAKAAAGAWKTMFKTLEEGPRPVVASDPSQVSSYFGRLVIGAAGTPGPVDAASDPIAASDLARFTVEVRVHLGEATPLDSDNDGQTETDMCEMEVLVTWKEPPQAQDQVYRLATVFTLADFNRARDT